MHEVDDAEHALVVGMVHGVLLSHGLDIEPEFDEQGNYLASIELIMPEPALGTRVRLIVERMEQ